MIIHMRASIKDVDIEVAEVCKRAKKLGLRPEIKVQEGSELRTVQINLCNDKVSCGSVPEHQFDQMSGVGQVFRVTPAQVSVASSGGRRHTLMIGGTKIGPDQPVLPVIGPCTVDLLTPDTVKCLADLGVEHIRGGCWKPRSRAAGFRGMREQGLRILLTSARESGIKSVWTEITSPEQLPIIRLVKEETGYEGDIVLWVGARNIGNQDLLEVLGCQYDFPVMLKNGINMVNVTELFDRADFILHGPMAWNEDGTLDVEGSKQQGNQNLILCVRGLQKHDAHDPHRFHPNYGWISEIHERSWAPVCLDPSHMAGELPRVFTCLKASLAYGPDVVMVESHINPDVALCDGQQAVPISRVCEVLDMVESHNHLAITGGVY